MFKFNPYVPEYFINPYKILNELRSLEPVYKSIGFGEHVYILSEYEQIKSILSDSRFKVENLPERIRNKELFVRGSESFFDIEISIKKWLFFIENEDHVRIRKVFAKAFSPKAIESYRSDIQQVVKDLVEQHLASGQLDLMNDLAFPLPTVFMSRLLGIPINDQAMFLKWTSDLFFVFQRPISLVEYRKVNESASAFNEYLKTQIKNRREGNSSCDDLLNHLLTYSDDKGALTDDEIISLCAMLFGVGQETAGNLIGNGILALLEHPEQIRLLRTQQVSIADAVEEIGRYDTPVQFIERETRCHLQLGKYEIPEGSTIFLCLAAANRDPKRYENADAFDITRGAKHTLPYGGGRHYCLGAILARIVTEEALSFLLTLDDLQADADKLVRRKSMIIRSLLSFPISFKPKN